MATQTITIDGTVAGIPISGKHTYDPTGQIALSPAALTAAKAGTLTTRTDDDTGVITLTAGHGITDSDIVAVFWTGGFRTLMTVTAYDATTVSIDGGSGTVLPADESAVTIAKAVSIDTDFIGNLVARMAAKADYRCAFDFLDGSGASLAQVEVATDGFWLWFAALGTNPLAGDTVASVKAFSGTTVASTLNIGVEYAA